MPGGRAVLLAPIQARIEIYVRDPSWRESFTCPFSYIYLLNTLLLFPSAPIIKPFSSIL
jgi:hypothetical protein